MSEKIEIVVPFPTDMYLILSGKLLYSIRYHFTLLRDLRDVIDDKLYLKICDLSSQYSEFKIGSNLTHAIDEILENDIDDDVHDFLQSMARFNDNITSIYEQILNGKPITGEYGHQEYDRLTETDLAKYIEYVNEKATKIKRISRA